MLATPTKLSPNTDAPSSDDLAFIGQVTPRRLISPAMRRIHESLDSDPPSDDSVLQASPSRDRVARRIGLPGSTPAKVPTSLSSHTTPSKTRSGSKPSGYLLRSGIKRKSISSLFGSYYVAMLPIG